ncbi:nuclear pore complex protein Nup160 isoform X1 [Phyllobates terribilis]|uniref:nuclear pore complex protein Nup160 isoform X1 n=1 Tax=Phyllobates terribilis TaxID=111132 RepID=UPI003CCAE7EF
MAASVVLERSFTELSAAERERKRQYRDVSLRPDVTPIIGGPKYSESAGGYYYKESSSVLAVTRNRLLYWTSYADTLELVEESLDVNLQNNAVRLKIFNCAILPGGVHVCETQSNVIVLILTNQTVHRLVLPHPSHLYRSEMITDSQMQSIFTEFGKMSYSDPANTYVIPALPGRSQGSVASAAWLSSEGETLFAFPSSSGGILVVKMPPCGVAGAVTVVELKQMSVRRLLTGFIPTAIRGEQDPAHLPVSLAVHCLENDAFIFALCQDHKLRMWSYKDQTCLMESDMLEFVPVSKEMRHIPGVGHKLRLAHSTSIGLYLGVYLHSPGQGQFCVFQLVTADSNRYCLDHVSSLFSNQDPLVDFMFTLTTTDIWALWLDDENQTVVKRINFEHNHAGQWNQVFINPLPDEELNIGDEQDPRETYREYLFSPGRFTIAALLKALQIYHRGSREKLQDLTGDELKKEITKVVEDELRGQVIDYEMDQDEFRQLQAESWAKFYTCCVQYQEELSRPLALMVHPCSSMVCLLRKDFLSFLAPCPLVDHLYLLPAEHLQTADESVISDDVDLASDTIFLMQCLRMIGDSITVDMAYMMEWACCHQEAPERVAEQILEELIANDIDNVMDGINLKLQDIRNPVQAIGNLHREMDYETSMDIDQTMDLGQPLNVRMNLSNLYGSTTAAGIVCQAVCKISLTRFLICRDLLILQQLLLRAGDTVFAGEAQLLQAQEEHIPRTANMLLSYYVIRWSSQCVASAVPQDALDSNLQHLSVLELSDSQTCTSVSKDPSGAKTIVELFFQDVARKRLSQIFARYGAAQMHNPLSGAQLITDITTYLLQHLWPGNPGFLFPECLMRSCQYTQLQEYVRLLQPWCQVSAGSCLFMMGQCYLVTGEGHKALECFCKAAPEVEREDFLEKLIHVDEEDPPSSSRLQYYNRVLRLLEGVGLPELVIQLATLAISETADDQKSQATLRTRIFKYHLDLRHNSQAYDALTLIPDHSRQLDCLRQLVIVLCERSQLQELVEFPYVNLQNEVVSIIEARARAVDLLSHNYYELLYAFHIYRHNYRKAGTVMFEYGMRLGREVRTLPGLQKQVNAYLACLNCLQLIRSEYAWIVQPASGAVYERPGASPKRNHEGESLSVPGECVLQASRTPFVVLWSLMAVLHSPGGRQVEILELRDLEKEYVLARTRLTLARHDDNVVAVAGSASAEEMVSLLVQAGLFDTAISLCQTYNLPLVPVFDGLTYKCIKLQNGGEAAQAEGWQWLAENQLLSMVTTKESSATDEAWRLLISYLEKYPSQNRRYHRCVIDQLLSYGIPLPSWLTISYKEVDAAELLRLYLKYDLLEEAAELVLEYVDAILGKGHRDFGIEWPLSALSPLVWLPYSSIDHLLQALEENNNSRLNRELREKLGDKLGYYFQKLGESTSHLLGLRRS